MKVLALYKSKHGTTKKCLEIIKEESEAEIKILEVRSNLSINVAEYDHIIIAGSIYAGQMNSELKEFVEENKYEINKTGYSLIVICGKKDVYKQQLIDNFGTDFVKKAFKVIYGGYAYELEDMNLAEKLIVRFVVKQKVSVLQLNEEELRAFAKELK